MPDIFYPYKCYLNEMSNYYNLIEENIDSNKLVNNNHQNLINYCMNNDLNIVINDIDVIKINYYREINPV